MAILDAMVSSGFVTIIALFAIAIELLALLIYSRLRGLAGSAALLANALSGACLILALRAALLDYGAQAVALFLGLALLTHLTDVVLRLKRAR